MTLTLAQLKGYARLAVGGSPSTAPGVTEADRLVEIVNGAGSICSPALGDGVNEPPAGST